MKQAEQRAVAMMVSGVKWLCNMQCVKSVSRSVDDWLTIDQPTNLVSNCIQYPKSKTQHEFRAYQSSQAHIVISNCQWHDASMWIWNAVLLTVGRKSSTWVVSWKNLTLSRTINPGMHLKVKFLTLWYLYVVQLVPNFHSWSSPGLYMYLPGKLPKEVAGNNLGMCRPGFPK